ncbi:phosphatase PAP2 family protein [candidate division KSB1 bacterium]|nr:MAG: phosphatase PAP2 family protein [candidate division KSB1 bacterium]MBC6948743.1 phosphatase PAP2 family protein [candidate division KSB1 bacterium]MCE7940578.1 phosphatase PAP2 family protein [Chlorobi bacterium CHB1]MDL1875062.1 phosphatase PAP2 family protein [Cytophagia bacterium CHB2]
MLLPWAVCVAFSRVVLWVHSLRDVVAGSFIGMLIGVLAFGLVYVSLGTLLRRIS